MRAGAGHERARRGAGRPVRAPGEREPPAQCRPRDAERMEPVGAGGGDRGGDDGGAEPARGELGDDARVARLERHVWAEAGRRARVLERVAVRDDDDERTWLRILDRPEIG